MTAYSYTDRDLLEHREHYFYSALQGSGFADTYREARDGVLATLPDDAVPPALTRDAPYPDADATEIVTDTLLDALEARVEAAWLDRLVQRFEVTKRLYASYDGRMRAPQGSCTALAPYARLACLLATDIEASGSLKNLSTLLKLNDLLCSQPPAQRDTVAGMLRRSLHAERGAIDALASKAGSTAHA